jgi:hypothetical protein
MGKLPNIVEAEALLVLAGLSDEEMIKTIHRATDSQWGEVLTAANVRNASGKAGIPGTPEKTNNPKKIKDKQRKMKVWVKGLSGITKYLTVENTTKEFRNEIIKELHDITNALKILNHEDDRGSK